MRAPHRVLVADDHRYTRMGVRLALEERGFSVVAEATTADTAVEAAIRHKPDVCVLDLMMPGGGVSAARRILARLPGTAVVMLTASDAVPDLFAAISAGVHGYVLKEAASDRLAPTLEAVLQGEVVIPRRMTTHLVQPFRAAAAPRTRARTPTGEAIALTAREQDVAGGLLQGFSTARMALELHVSEITVRRHVSGLMGKLNVKSRTELLDVLRDQRDAQGATRAFNG